MAKPRFIQLVKRPVVLVDVGIRIDLAEAAKVLDAGQTEALFLGIAKVVSASNAEPEQRERTRR